MEGRRRAGNLEEGLKNTDIKRETDIRNSLGPQDEGSGRMQRSSGDNVSGRGSADEGIRQGDAFGRETPGLSEDME
jgi:hypothetical protein